MSLHRNSVRGVRGRKRQPVHDQTAEREITIGGAERKTYVSSRE
jgi:hypothetical protein